MKAKPAATAPATAAAVHTPAPAAVAPVTPPPADPQVGGRFERLPDGSLRALDTPPTESE